MNNLAIIVPEYSYETLAAGRGEVVAPPPPGPGFAAWRVYTAGIPGPGLQKPAPAVGDYNGTPAFSALILSIL